MAKLASQQTVNLKIPGSSPGGAANNYTAFIHMRMLHNGSASDFQSDGESSILSIRS